MVDLASPVKVKQLLRQHKFKTSKALGQNFLVDGNIIAKIIQASGLTKEDLAVEIGPGIGVLTSALAKQASHVLAVELDRQLAPILQQTLAPYPNAEVIFADALTINFDQLVAEKTAGKFGSHKGYHLVANLPYYITTPLLMHMLESKFNFDTLTLMMQREVALRLVAQPGTKEYGALSVAVQYYAAPEIAFRVPATVFHPRPAVESAVVRLSVRSQPPIAVTDEQVFFKVVGAAFGQRRKTLLNALTGGKIFFDKAKGAQTLSRLAIDPKRRGETLSIEEFATIANALSQ